MKNIKPMPYLILYNKYEVWSLILIVTILFVCGCSKSKDEYNLIGSWVCDHNVEYKGNLQFNENSYNLIINYEFFDSISGSINESGQYSYTSDYHEPDGLFSSGYYYGTISFDSGNNTYSIRYSNGTNESFSFESFRIHPSITVKSMCWAHQ